MDTIASDRPTLSAIWPAQHAHAEFVLKDADAALATSMTGSLTYLHPVGSRRCGARQGPRLLCPSVPADAAARSRADPSVADIRAVSAWSKGSSCASPTRWPWTGCCPAWRPRAARSSSPGGHRRIPRTARCPTSTPTGTGPSRSQPARHCRSPRCAGRHDECRAAAEAV